MGTGPGDSIGDDVQVVLAETAALDANLTYLPLVRTGKRELEMLFDGINNKNIAVELESALLIDNAGEITCLAELRWTAAKMLKEMLV